MNELQAMRTLAQVVASGSFANAARALDVVPAVVTRLVQDLERHLGARLITRTTRRLSLTDVGQRYVQRVQAILAAVDDATALARESQASPSGALRVPRASRCASWLRGWRASTRPCPPSNAA